MGIHRHPEPYAVCFIRRIDIGVMDLERALTLDPQFAVAPRSRPAPGPRVRIRWVRRSMMFSRVASASYRVRMRSGENQVDQDISHGLSVAHGGFELGACGHSGRFR